MNRTCDIAPGRERSSRPEAKEILRAAENRLIALTDRLFAALERDRERRQLGRLDDRMMKDVGWPPGGRESR